MSGGVADTVRGRIDGDGRLIAADPLLAALHRRAGGVPGGTMAVPQIASVARLARRLNSIVSRGIVAADGESDLDLWIRAQPDGVAVQLAIAGWRRRPAPLPFLSGNAERQHDFIRADADWVWETDALLRLGPIESAFAEWIGSAADSFAGQPLTRLFTLIERADGAMPMLLALAERKQFLDQAAELKMQPGVSLVLAGVPMMDRYGGFAGFRGTASAVSREAVAPDGGKYAEQARQVQGAAFSRRLNVALRQPLDRIIEQAESIGRQDDGPLGRAYADYATDIATAARHLLALVGDLVDLETIEHPDFTLRRDLVDMADVARRAAAMLSVRAADRNVRIERPEPEEPLPATAEFRRALQIVVNLIGNALRYSPEGGTIWVHCARAGDRIALIVADHGKGIDPADQARIFDKFERVDPTEPGGTGLGLYIARRLARAMGGELVVESAAGEGARFALTLPAA